MTIPLIFIFAFVVRLVNLNQSLWLDEAVVAKVIRSVSFFQIPLQFSPSDFHPPLYYLFMSLWGNVFGTSEIALRLPSIIFSLIAGLFVYKIGLLLKDRRTALWSLVLFLFNPLIIYYSQEARMYMLATAFLTASLYYFFRIVIPMKIGIQKSNGNYIDPVSQHGMTNRPGGMLGKIFLFNLLTALALFTFYGSIFFIGAMAIVGFFVIPMQIGIQKEILYRFRIKYGMTILLLVGSLISLLILSPLLFQQLQNAQVGMTEVRNWSLVLGKAELKNFLMIFLKFATGRISWYPKWSYYLYAGIAATATWIVALFGMKRNKMVAFLFFFPLLSGLLISFVTPMMMYFRFLYLVPAMSILLAMGVTSAQVGIQKGIFYRFRIEYGMTAIFIVFSALYLVNPQFHREDWKKMAQDISPSQPVYMILPSSDPLRYYNSTLSLSELREIDKTTLPQHIQVIPYVEELYRYNHTSILEKKGCILETKSTYRGPLILENWNCTSEFVALKP